MNSSPLKFPKSERLVSEKLISLLFKTPFVLKEFPLKFIWLKNENTENTVPVQVLITVPKRAVKLAVNRNRIKRQIRELYRLSSIELKQKLVTENSPIYLGIIYLGNKDVSFDLLERKINKLFSLLIKEI